MSEATSTAGATSIPAQTVSNITTPAPGAIETQTQPAVKEALRMLKIDGRELHLPESEIIKLAQKSGGVEKRFSEARALQQQIEARAIELDKRQREFEQRTGQFKGDETDVDRLIKQAQGDPQKLAKVRDRIEKWLIDQIKLEAASPEQQELIRNRQELEKERSEKQALLDEKQKIAQEQLTAKHRAGIEQTIIQALDISGLPPNEWNVKHMADLMHKAFLGKYSLTPEQLAERVRQDRIANTQSITKDYTDAINNAHETGDAQKVLLLGQNLENLMGPGLLKALRRYDLTKLKSGQPALPSKPVAIAAPKTIEEPKKAYAMSWDEADAERKRVVAQLEAEFRRGR